MDKNTITADEARRLADTSEVVRKRIYKCIKEAALEGQLEFTYYLGSNPSETLIKSIEEDLTSNGFFVSIITYEEEPMGTDIYVSWDQKDN